MLITNLLILIADHDDEYIKFEVIDGVHEKFGPAVSSFRVLRVCERTVKPYVKTLYNIYIDD